ncbi:probable serine/threonine-protein kinase PBL1 [Andrographis paniculata]|uniref:probable serine/threonine-protein kinase PBL1 n=1 Tax=Andrographis paniculata TaxID=175694 RepID=UPI0021E7383A|nr:probable serine/threonine-protein kinase PBL1 [Andrographis paniculata]XP_051130540.1 probable serine/threonine-protein kinase PBL1 [Andrographis paniculata]XP_051130541.1 probable serine/threonine-protein kinase PBL1 [Andrographis paniculata]XP_051130542.1 probable serine/threonine-protein kinase PBL1 [Andrographis paniculata]XP_051130543.1 probable serine/threonine-protein kinase PBL1 [Andrographis paniculata]
MGCFTVLKSKKKKSEKTIFVKRVNPQEQSPTELPEPQAHMRALQSAPPSFKTTVKPVQPNNGVSTSRTRTLSAPSRLDIAEQDALASMEYEEEGSRNRIGSMKEYNNSPNPQPLPLPSPRGTKSLRATTSFKMVNTSGPINMSGPLPLPPSSHPPLPAKGMLVNFTYEEISSACHNFSPERCMSEGLSSVIYRASFAEDGSGVRKLEATVTRLHTTNQGFKEFVNDVNTLASLQHPNLCKLIGFHAREGSDSRMLVYERLFHGSLERLLYGRSDGPPVDWNSRMKVSLCAAQGLTFLHEEGPFQAMFQEFSTANIQIDKDFSAKLSGYGCISHIPEAEISSSSVAGANLSVETLERGLLTPKSNVWSFGILLLELLTGRKHLDSQHAKEERNLVKWTRPFLADDCRLSLIMDPQLKGRFPAKAARTVADIAQRCLQVDPSERPTMRTVVEHLKTVQDMKYTSRFPLQEPGALSGKHISRSPSLNGIVTPAPRSNFSHSPPTNGRSISPTHLPALPLVLPPRTCSSTLLLEEMDRQESRRSSSLIVRRSSEGI